jgi:hypothetical protein
MRRMATLIIALMGLALIAAAARAEEPNLSREDLQKIATHVVVGKVNAICERVEEKGGWKYTRYVAELPVEECQKGTGLTSLLRGILYGLAD